ncbi:MAG: carbohydrate ABC transporter permease [Chloroflexi bacterium]|nr:carbohydrate ABC transporter permease [Chloroflexota bacterium]
MAIRDREIAALERRRLLRHYLGQAFLWTFIGLGLAFMVMPGVWMLLASFKTRAEIQAIPFKLFPAKFRWDNYVTAIEWMDFWVALKNSVLYTGSVTVLNILTCTWGGYTFCKLRWPGRDFLLLAILSTMMIPGFLTIIPHYVLTSWMGMLNSYWGMVLPGFTGAFGIFLTRQFMLGIPDELIDASTVDGCNALTTFFRIVLPLCKPIVSVLGIFVFNWSWDSLIWPLMILTDKKKWPLPVAIANLRLRAGGDLYELQMAGSTLAVIPVLIIFVWLQKNIVQGVALSGLKG